MQRHAEGLTLESESNCCLKLWSRSQSCRKRESTVTTTFKSDIYYRSLPSPDDFMQRFYLELFLSDPMCFLWNVSRCCLNSVQILFITWEADGSFFTQATCWFSVAILVGESLKGFGIITRLTALATNFTMIWWWIWSFCDSEPGPGPDCKKCSANVCFQ